jgi:hypothetical protein
MRLAKTLAKHVEFEYQRDRADTMDDDPEYRYAAVGE